MLLSTWIRNGLGAVIASTLLAGAAHAAPIAILGDDTTLEAAYGANALISAGASVSPLGSATTNALGELILPITGGSMDLAFLDGTLEHLGSGFEISRAGSSVIYQNLFVDLTNLQVFADVTEAPGGVAGPTAVGQLIFDISICSFSAGFDPCRELDGSYRLDPWGFRFTAGAADQLGQTIGLAAAHVDRLKAQHVVLAELDLRPVPEPGTALLLGAGALGLALAGRRRV